MALSFQNLALFYEDRGKYPKAEPLFKRSLAILEKALGSEHPTLVAGLENYAGFLRKTGNTAEAEVMEGRASAIRLKRARHGR